jgi:hypothetical protein
MTAASLLAFLITNGSSIIGAGAGIAGIATQFMAMFGKHSADQPVTQEQFDAFVDKCLGDAKELDAIIAAARADIKA